MRTSIWGLLRRTRRIEYLKLEGLQINVPPREEQVNGGPFSNFKKKFRAVRIDEIYSENAVLRTLTNKPGKDPLEFDIQHLRLTSSSNDGALDFVATLTNPRPPGQIVSTGTFGPWNPDTPSLTPVSGNYDFEKADLGVFPGIAGILNSKGSYQGVLEQIRRRWNDGYSRIFASRAPAIRWICPRRFMRRWTARTATHISSRWKPILENRYWWRREAWKEQKARKEKR